MRNLQGCWAPCIVGRELRFPWAPSSALLGNSCYAAGIQSGYCYILFPTVLSAYLWLQCRMAGHPTTLGILKLFRRNKCMEGDLFPKGHDSLPVAIL